MQTIDYSSREGIEDSLWYVGLNFHNFTCQQRMKILKSIFEHNDNLLDSDIFNFISYILHAYFLYMKNEEKRFLIDIMKQRFHSLDKESGDGIELIALLMKDCPEDYKGSLLEIINMQNLDSNSSPSKIIAYTNAIRYIFDEIPHKEQQKFYSSLLSIYESTRYNFLKPSILYTINNIKVLLKI